MRAWIASNQKNLIYPREGRILNFPVVRFGFDMKTSFTFHRFNHMTSINQISGAQAHIDRGNAPRQAHQTDHAKPYTRSLQPQFNPKVDRAKFSPEASALLIAQGFQAAGSYAFKYSTPAQVRRHEDRRIIITDQEDRYVVISPEGEIVQAEVMQGDLDQFLTKARTAR